MLQSLTGLGFEEIDQVEEGERPFWSVVVPVFQRYEFVERCVKSVLQQRKHPKDMEVILVEAGTVASSLSFGYYGVRHVAYGDDLGPSRNWNRAIRLARGKWIHLLHDDDYVLPGFYENLRANLQSPGVAVGCGAAFTGYENVNFQDEPIFQKDFSGIAGHVSPSLWLPALEAGNPLNPPCVVVSRTLYETIGGYRHGVTFCDWEFYLRACMFTTWWCEPKVLARYLERPRSATVQKNWFRYVQQVLDVAALYLPVNSVYRAKAHQFDEMLKYVLE